MNNKDLLKHIIWIEDFANNNITLNQIPSDDEWDSEDLSLENHQDDIQKTFGKYADNVIWFRDVPMALNFIDEYFSLYDFVVLDINLGKALNGNKEKKIKEVCEKQGILINDKDIGKSCGYYIYLYLLKRGFPASNVIMFTANKGTENTTGDWERKFENAGLKPPESIGKGENDEIGPINIGENNKIISRIEQTYKENYYKTRLLIIKACEYWKEKLSGMKKEDIAFNKIYYNTEQDMMIDGTAFINMLERIEMLLPITIPYCKSKIYYQVMQVISMFHEESAKIDKVKNYPVWRYHQAIRHFRNWSSHNKFISDSINDNQFAYLFVIALRTYFGAYEENEYNIDTELFHVYENELQLDIEEKMYSDFQSKYTERFEKNFDKVKKNLLPKEHKRFYECDNVYDIVYESGKCKEKSMEISDLLLVIMHCHIKCLPQNGTYTIEKGSLKFSITITMDFGWDKNKSIVKDKNDYFMYLAYALFLGGNDENIRSNRTHLYEST